MKEELEALLSNYDFLCEDKDINQTLQECLSYIKQLEKEINDYKEIIDIQRYNLSLYRNGKIKKRS